LFFRLCLRHGEPDVSKDEYAAFTITGPEGIDSGRLPMRVYVKKGSKAERAD
jgi:hypothetical protein